MSMLRISVAIALGLALPSAAVAAPITIRGTVTGATGRWTAGGTRIVTDAVIRTATGDVTVRQLGGSVDGLAMVSIPGAPRLAPGQRATVTAHHASTARGRSVLVVDDVAVEGVDETARFVRTGPTLGSHYVWWASGCVQVTYADEGTVHLAGDREFAVLDATLATWSGIDCGYMKLVGVGRKARAEVGNDRVNLIKFRDREWCRPATDDEPADCLEPNAAAITTLTYVDEPGSARDGEIIDADVEINGVDFAISAGGASLGAAGCNADLANTMTHELGHVLGLAHTCLLDPKKEGTPVDHLGVAVPLCSRAQAQRLTQITEATMFPSQTCGEVSKATLATDDIAAFCAVFPIAEDPAACEEPEPTAGGCCSATDRPIGSLLLAAVIAFALGRRRR